MCACGSQRQHGVCMQTAAGELARGALGPRDAHADAPPGAHAPGCSGLPASPGTACVFQAVPGLSCETGVVASRRDVVRLVSECDRVHRNRRVTCSEEGPAIMTTLLVMGQRLGQSAETPPAASPHADRCRQQGPGGARLKKKEVKTQPGKNSAAERESFVFETVVREHVGTSSRGHRLLPERWVAPGQHGHGWRIDLGKLERHHGTLSG